MSISFSQLYVSLFESWIRILERFDYSFHHYSLLLPDKFLYCPRLHYYTGYCNLLDCWKTLWTTNGDPFHHCSLLLTDKKFYIVHGNVSILQHCSRMRFQQTFLRSRPPLLSASYWTVHECPFNKRFYGLDHHCSLLLTELFTNAVSTNVSTV